MHLLLYISLHSISPSGTIRPQKVAFSTCWHWPIADSLKFCVWLTILTASRNQLTPRQKPSGRQGRNGRNKFTRRCYFLSVVPYHELGVGSVSQLWHDEGLKPLKLRVLKKKKRSHVTVGSVWLCDITQPCITQLQQHTQVLFIVVNGSSLCQRNWLLSGQSLQYHHVMP